MHGWPSKPLLPREHGSTAVRRHLGDTHTCICKSHCPCSPSCQAVLHLPLSHGTLVIAVVMGPIPVKYHGRQYARETHDPCTSRLHHGDMHAAYASGCSTITSHLTMLHKPTPWQHTCSYAQYPAACTHCCPTSGCSSHPSVTCTTGCQANVVLVPLCRRSAAGAAQSGAGEVATSSQCCASAVHALAHGLSSPHRISSQQAPWVSCTGPSPAL
jgi:hypothetical protein